MSAAKAALLEHLATGATTVCRAWSIERRDGNVLGFTDHDRPLEFEGVRFRPESGMSARAVEQVTGLAPDTSEAVGILTDDAIREDDLAAGAFDNARVTVWMVNWRDPSQRMVEFAGHLGEIARRGMMFRAEILGLSHRLNRLAGRIFQSNCDAGLGDARCRFDLDTPGYRVEAEVLWVKDGFRFGLAGLEDFADRWFERGTLAPIDGPGSGLAEVIRWDRRGDGPREVALWVPPRREIGTGDRLTLTAGCDKKMSTCREKFQNFNNFRGFPHIPGEDWLKSYPTSATSSAGGRRR